MLLVLVFVVLFLALMGTAYRGVAALLRVESVRALQVQRDEGSTQAVARALALLETGVPPTDPYVCGVTIDTSTGPRALTVTFALENDQNGTRTYTVRSAPTEPGETPQAMPETFATRPP
jgi:hypothetical protein